MAAPAVIAILQLGAPVAAGVILGGFLLLARAVENSRDRRSLRAERRIAAAAGQRTSPNHS